MSTSQTGATGCRSSEYLPRIWGPDAGAGWLGMSLNVPARLMGEAPAKVLFLGIQPESDIP